LPRPDRSAGDHPGDPAVAFRGLRIFFDGGKRGQTPFPARIYFRRSTGVAPTPGPVDRVSWRLRRRFSRGLPVSSEVRHDSEQSLDDGQLRPMVHFVLFGPEKHLEARFGTAAALAHLFGQPRFGTCLDPLRSVLPFRAQQVDDFALGTRPVLLLLRSTDELSEVEAFERRATLF